MKKIVVFTGAGVSADSGLATFRDSDGLWANYRIEDVCTPEALRDNPMPAPVLFLIGRVAALAEEEVLRLPTAEPAPLHKLFSHG